MNQPIPPPCKHSSLYHPYQCDMCAEVEKWQKLAEHRLKVILMVDDLFKAPEIYNGALVIPQELAYEVALTAQMNGR